jgi:hypothetical protein
MDIQNFEQLGSRAEKPLAYVQETPDYNFLRATEYSDRRSSCFSSAHPGKWPEDASITPIFPLKINHSYAIDAAARLRCQNCYQTDHKSYQSASARSLQRVTTIFICSAEEFYQNSLLP